MKILDLAHALDIVLYRLFVTDSKKMLYHLTKSIVLFVLKRIQKSFKANNISST